MDQPSSPGPGRRSSLDPRGYDPRGRPTRPERDDGKGNSYVRYSGLAFQMMATIGLGIAAGMWLDGYFELAFPAFTIGLSVVSFTVALVVVYRRVMGPENK